MKNQLLVIDDDIDLVTELRHHLKDNYQHILVDGPPDLPLDLAGIREHLTDTKVIILDLNIGGSNTYGQTLLKRLARQLDRLNTPVIVWSKYLMGAVTFEPTGVYRLVSADSKTSIFEATYEKSLESSKDYTEQTEQLRKIYGGVQAFVSKASPDPAKLLCDVLKRLGVITPETRTRQPS